MHKRDQKEIRNQPFLSLTLSHTHFSNEILGGRIFSFTARTLPTKTHLS